MNYKRYLKKKKFLGVNLIGWGTLALVMIGALVMGLVPNAIVVPVSKTSQWVLFYADDMDRWQLDSGVAKKDFQNQGWNIITKIGIGERSDAESAWRKYNNDYKNNPTICLINNDRTPIYDQPYYWAWYTHVEVGGSFPSTSPGTVFYKEGNDELINGNSRQFDATDYVLIRFVNWPEGRTTIIVWTAIRFDTGQLQGFVLAWRWVCVYGAYHEKNWYILDNRGNIVDSEVIPSDEAESSGDNPEDNPLVNPEDGGDYTNPEEPLPTEPIYDPMRQTRAILLIAGLLAVLVAMGGFTLWFGKKIKLFI